MSGPLYLTDFVSYLEPGGQEGARASKIKKVISENVIPPPLQGAKRKLDCITSGSRQFETTAKKLATWKDTAENKPVPMNCRLEQKDYFNYMSTVGESSLGDITLINHNHGNDHRVRLPVHRFKVTRSYGYGYRFLSCQKGHSVLDPDSITIVLADQSRHHAT